MSIHSIDDESMMDNVASAEHLQARVVDAAAEGLRLHGFNYFGDIAQHYSFSEIAYLSLVGELPSEKELVIFSILLRALAPRTVGDGSTHVARIANRIGASTSAVLSTGIVGIVEEASFQFESSETRRAEQAQSPDEVASLTYLRSQLSHEEHPFVHDDANSFKTSVRYLFDQIHFREEHQRLATVVLSRIPFVIAEAMSVRSGALLEYPLQVPEFRYERQKDQ